MSPENNSASSRTPSSPPAKPTTSQVSDRLTKLEIESLREHGRAVHAYAREAFKDWRPDSPHPQNPGRLPASDRLTKSEIEALRRDKKKAAAYGRKTFKHWRPDQLPK